MKKLITIIAVAASIAANAQTNQPVQLNFFNQAATWSTSFNTNYSWSDIKLQFEDGYNQTSGEGASDYLRAQYNFSRWNVTLEGDFFGVGSSFNAVEGGGGYALIQEYDFKAELNALAGGEAVADSTAFRFKAEAELRITKLLTSNTYATASLSIPWVQGQTFTATPAIRVGLGFTF